MLAPARIIVGGGETLAVARGIVERANAGVWGDVFKLTDQPLAQSLADAGDRGVAVRLLMDPEFPEQQSRALLDAARGVEHRDYGQLPTKNHVKAFASEREGVISTGAFLPETADRFDLAVHLRGNAADALRQLLEASYVGRTDEVVDAAAAGRPFGIFLNDAKHGVHDLTNEIERMLDHPRDVLIATKRFQDFETADQLARLGNDGSHVVVATRTLPAREQLLLDAAHVRTLDVPKEPASLHGNVIVADDTAYVGSAFLHKRALLRDRAVRQSRELGYVTRVPQEVAQLRAAVIARLEQSGLDASPR